MDDKLLKVKIIFDKVKEMRDEINILFEGLDGRISKLGEIYNEFVKNAKMIKTPDVKAFIFSLDSFYFQNSLLSKEYQHLKDYYSIIINRMYGEYYKLYKLMTEYIDKSHIDSQLNENLKKKNYPKYDDLDEGKHYDFHLIIHLNEDIIGVVNYLINILRDKEIALKMYKTNQNYGLNVDNFVSTFNYEVIVLQEQINLYEKYLDFFYHVHEKLLKRLITKISVLEAQLNADIKFEGGLIGKRKDNSDIMKDMNIKGLNKRAVRELRKSITGGNSPCDSSIDDDSTDYIPNSSEETNTSSIISISNDSSNVEIKVTESLDLKDNSEERSLVDKLFSEQLSQEDKEIQSILKKSFSNENIDNFDKKGINNDVNIVDSNEVQQHATRGLQSSITDISPRHPELSYYENEKLYNDNNDSDKDTQEVKDKSKIPNEYDKSISHDNDNDDNINENENKKAETDDEEAEYEIVNENNEVKTVLEKCIDTVNNNAETKQEDNMDNKNNDKDNKDNVSVNQKKNSKKKLKKK